MQEIVKNQPDQHNKGYSPGDNLKGTNAIDTVWITPDHIAVYPERPGIVSPRFFAAGFFRFRSPAAGFVLLSFFLTGFHAIKWE